MFCEILRKSDGVYWLIMDVFRGTLNFLTYFAVKKTLFTERMTIVIKMKPVVIQM